MNDRLDPAQGGRGFSLGKQPDYIMGAISSPAGALNMYATEQSPKALHDENLRRARSDLDYAPTIALWCGINAYIAGMSRDENPFSEKTEKHCRDNWFLAFDGSEDDAKKVKQLKETNQPTQWWQKW